MNIKKSIILRVRLAFLVMGIFAIAIVAKMGKIQFVEGSKWTQMAESFSLDYQIVKAARGNIYSDNGSLMATSLPFYRVAIDPSVVPEEIYKNGLDPLATKLAQYFGDKDARSYKRLLKNGRAAKKQYIILNKKRISYQDKKMMGQWPIFKEGRLKGGVIFEKVNKRFYPFSNLGTRTIGFINENSNGAGLEYSFNQNLAGSDGQALYQKIAGGGWKPVYDGTEVRAQEGQDIETTIDINLQDVAETALLRALENHDADYGSVVVMEVQTGEIKAISNLSKNKAGKYWELYNYAVGNQGVTEPGSTFKLASMIALLEEEQISLADTIDTGKGRYEFYDKVMRDHKPGGMRRITVREAFSKSSNIGISRLINQQFGLNPDKFLAYIDQMGLSEPLGFQMKGEGKPFIKRSNDPTWSGVTLPWMSIGYELELTPLQTLTFYNAVANQGKMIKPIIVKKISKAGVPEQEFKTEVLRENICSASTLEKVKFLLEQVVQEGTAKNIKDSHYPIAGKTGTARKVKKGGGYERKYYTSFAGYFPADRPQYSCIVVIDNPKGYQQYGSDVAAPVFKEIADKIYSKNLSMHAAMKPSNVVLQGHFPVVQSGLQKDLQLICNELGISNHTQEPAEWVVAQRNYNSIKWQKKEMRSDQVPNVQGMMLRDALYLLENNGLKVKYNGIGRVVKQSIVPGKAIAKGDKIVLALN